MSGGGPSNVRPSAAGREGSGEESHLARRREAGDWMEERRDEVKWREDARS